MYDQARHLGAKTVAKKTGHKLDKGQFVKFQKYLRLYYVLPKNIFDANNSSQ